MTAQAQVNIRVPEAARDVLLKVGAKLRQDPAAVEALEAFLASLDDPTATPALADRVAALEARLAKLEAGT